MEILKNNKGKLGFNLFSDKIYLFECSNWCDTEAAINATGQLPKFAS